MLLDREVILELLTQLGSRLHSRGVEAELYVVGGTAMALVYDRQVVTRDIDATFKPASVVQAEAEKLAMDHPGLPKDWLNSKVAPLLPLIFDENQVEALAAPGISVNVASPQHLLAMKVRAARDERDLQDVLALCRILKIRHIDEVWVIAQQVWGDDFIRDDNKQIVSDYLDSFDIR